MTNEGRLGATTSTWVRVAAERESFTVGGLRRVRFGSGTSWVEKTVAREGTCSNAFFGADPVKGFAKVCEALESSEAPLATSEWTLVSMERGKFNVANFQRVRFGFDGRWVEKVLTGEVECSQRTFGSDPLPGFAKQCELWSGKGVTNLPPLLTAAQRDATRLAFQATFGPTESLVTDMVAKGNVAWLQSQFASAGSKYTSGGNGDFHRWTRTDATYCQVNGALCTRDALSAQPLLWDFYRNALKQPDQLRQRTALALQHIFVVSNSELVSGTYGFRRYHNMLLSSAFGNYSTLLRNVAVSPLMGDYLNNANNDPKQPNENFARELLQLFSIGNCALNSDGSLTGGKCVDNYDNQKVRDYAYALTGWTYPLGGAKPAGCWPTATNCRYYDGDMVASATRHNGKAIQLLSNVQLPEGNTAAQALDAVVASLMAHPSLAPNVSTKLIQHFVTSNPSPGYVQRVASAFSSGKFQAFGKGQKGDLEATIAAVLLDPEARASQPSDSFGKLKEPVLFTVGLLRALNGTTDGESFGFWWGESLREHLFQAPSVFGFFSADYPIPNALKAPEFSALNSNTALNRINFINQIAFRGGMSVDRTVPNATGTYADLTKYESFAGDASMLVDRISAVAIGDHLPVNLRSSVITAVETIPLTAANAKQERVKQATYLIFGSPEYAVQR